MFSSFLWLKNTCVLNLSFPPIIPCERFTITTSFSSRSIFSSYCVSSISSSAQGYSFSCFFLSTSATANFLLAPLLAQIFPFYTSTFSLSLLISLHSLLPLPTPFFISQSSYVSCLCYPYFTVSLMIFSRRESSLRSKLREDETLFSPK